ncbi:MAG: hypothetical protein OEZ06_09385 [Myxococcales bacterium]|nr:hypothetical protein [Myxococcales bacterium]
MRRSVRDREAKGTPLAGTQRGGEQALSFERDIKPLFAPFASAMMWRFDLTNYEAVKGNAEIIWGRLSNAGNAMPPPPFPMFTAAELQLYFDWMKGGCKP